MTIPGGYILLSRKLIESEIFDKPPLYTKVWVYLLSKAQFKQYKKLNRGQLFTTLSEIQEACSWHVGYRKETPSKSQIYRVIDWLRKSGEPSPEQNKNEKMIETTKATQGMIVTIVNYNYYQDPKNYDRNTESNDENGANATRPKQQRNNINKECIKNVSKNDKNNSNKVTLVRTFEKIQTKRFKKLLPPKERPKFDEDSIPYKAAIYLRKRILSNNPRQPVPKENPKDLEGWAVELERLNRLGPKGAKKSEGKGYTWEEIRELIDWCQESEFWQTNILSADKLRKKITQLETKMKNDKNYAKKETEETMSSLYQKYKQEEEEGIYETQ